MRNSGEKCSVYSGDDFTPRERQAAFMVASGMAYSEIGREMGVTVGTVKQYLHRVYSKTGVHGRRELLPPASQK